MEIPQKVKNRTTIHSYGIPLLGIYSKNMKTLVGKDICTPMFTAALFTIAKIWKPPKCLSMDGQMKMWYIYTMEYYSAMKMKSCHLQHHGWPRGC